jgi:hypothetical protein
MSNHEYEYIRDLVREALAIAWPEGDHAEPNVYTEALASLDLIEQRAAEMEPLAERYIAAEDLAKDYYAQLTDMEAKLKVAQREADIQMAEKLAAQMTLKAVCDVLNLPMVSLGNGWTEATPKILARIEEILDEADRGFRERDAAETYNARLRETLARVRPDIDPETGYGRREAI